MSEEKDIDALAFLEQLIGSVEGPSDWASEHDHYLYGSPKRRGTEMVSTPPEGVLDCLVSTTIREIWVSWWDPIQPLVDRHALARQMARDGVANTAANRRDIFASVRKEMSARRSS